MSATPGAGGNTVKNIVIAILTTVVAYAIVAFLGIGKSGKNSETKLRKEATVNAWASVNDYINYANQTFKTLACHSCNQEEMKQEMIRELDQNINSLTNLKEDRNIDDKMRTIIDRTIDKFKALKPAYQEYFDSLIHYAALKQESPEAVVRMQQNLFKKTTWIQSRDANYVNELIRDLNKKYKTEFLAKPLDTIFEPSNLPGKWKIECSFELEFSSDGSLSLTLDGKNMKGRWILSGKKLTFKLDNGETINYTIIELDKTLIRMNNDDFGIMQGGCRQ